MSDFQLHEEEPVDGRTIDDIVDGVAQDLGLSREAHLDVKLKLREHYIRSTQALADAIKEKKLCGVVHPYVADALYNRLNNKPNETFEYDVYPETRLQTRNPTHFKNVAIFVHRVAPIPGSNKGKIACTWAFDVDPEVCSVKEMQQRLERLVSTSAGKMRIVFNGFTLSATNTLAEYDVRGGDSLYLYTVKDPNETTVVCCSSSSSNMGPHHPAAANCNNCCSCNCQGAAVSPAALRGRCPASMPATQCAAAAAAAPPPACACCCPQGRCSVSQAVLTRPYRCHTQRCLCGCCTTTAYSPLQPADNRR